MDISYYRVDTLWDGHMSNSSIKFEKREKTASTSDPRGIIGDYATVEELIEAKKAKLIDAVPELDLPVLLQRLQQ